VLALLALLALSQIRSRHQVARIAADNKVDPLGRLLKEFPPILESRRASADDLLLIGVVLSRTISSYNRYIGPALNRGARIRIVVFDPEIADRMAGNSGAPTSRLGARIRHSLEELQEFLDRGDQFEMRVMSEPPSSTFNVLDADTPNGLVVLQRREAFPIAESAPIIAFTPSDGPWYRRAADEAERIWTASTPWPKPAGVTTAHVVPQFTQDFDDNPWKAIAEARDILITGVARNTLLTAHFSDLEAAVAAGGKVRVVLIDPDSDAVIVAADRYYAERSADTLRERIRHTRRLLGELARITSGEVALRYTTHPISLGAIVTAPSREDPVHYDTLFAEYYTFQAPGEPKITLRGRDGFAFNNLVNEAELLWTSGADQRLDDGDHD
jgi:hypothetical protein